MSPAPQVVHELIDRMWEESPRGTTFRFWRSVQLGGCRFVVEFGKGQTERRIATPQYRGDDKPPVGEWVEETRELAPWVPV